MFVRNLKECQEFIAGDGCTLRELLHPDKADLDIRYSLAHAKVAAGQTTQPHKLRTSEVYYILSGTGVMHIGREAHTVTEHCVTYIPPGETQYIENTGDSDLEFLCIVDPAWQKADEIILDS